MADRTNYGLYLTGNGSTIRFPVNPEEYTISHGSDNVTHNVLDIGEIVVPRIPSLIEIRWDGLLPGDANRPYVLTAGDFKPPDFYISRITGFKKNKDVIRFIANRYDEAGSILTDTNIKAIIEDFTVTERGGETGDFYYSISIREYRSYTPQTVSINLVTQNTATATVTEQREIPSNQICVGDTVIANGRYWYTSYGDSPYGTANNRQTTVTRIVGNPTAGQIYPIHIGQLGWLKLDQLKKV